MWWSLAGLALDAWGFLVLTVGTLRQLEQGAVAPSSLAHLIEFDKRLRAMDQSLRQYDRLGPGTAERIGKMVKEETVHRERMNRFEFAAFHTGHIVAGSLFVIAGFILQGIGTYLSGLPTH